MIHEAMHSAILLYIDPGSGYVLGGVGGWIGIVLGTLLFHLVGFLKNHKKRFALFLLLLLLAGAGIMAMFMNNKNAAFHNKVVVLGFDALSPEIIEPMIVQGKLPHFARLQRQGAYRRLSTTNPAQSPVAWAGFLTGKNPGKNGVFDFITMNKQTRELNLVFSRMRFGRPVSPLRTEGFWDYTSRRKIWTVVLGAPDTFPAEKLHGRMLSGMGVPDILGTEGTFTFYTSGKLGNDNDVGGKCFHVKRSPVMVMNFIGPRVHKLNATVQNVTVPFKFMIVDDRHGSVEYQNKKLELTVGKWSGWNEIEFPAGWFKWVKGICRFYLAATGPEFALYISPINFHPRAPMFPISYPAKYSRELADQIGYFHTQGMPMDTWAVNEGRLSEDAFLEQAEEVFRERKAVLGLELKRFEEGVLFAYFESVDIIQHMFWRYQDPGQPAADQRFRQEIERWYQKMDAVLGDVMRVLGQDDTLIVLSDHGFGAFDRAAHLNSWLREKGYLFLKDDMLPDGERLFRDVDWSRTKAYALGFGGIYINQKGRDAGGTVAPGEEPFALKRAIVAGLEKWTDPQNGRPVVHKVYDGAEIFRGPHAADAPDLYVGFPVGYRASWQTAIGGVPAGLLEDNLKNWSGDHLFDPALVPGVIFANREIRSARPSIYDITPTILQTVGYTEEEIQELDFDGKPLFK